VTSITFDEYNQVVALIDDGLSVRKAAMTVGRSLAGLHDFCKRHSLPRLMAKPRGRKITADLIAPYLPDFISGRITRIVLAEKLGCTMADLRKYIELNKIKPLKYSSKTDDYQRVCDYVIKHGGCPTHAIKALGIKSLSGPVYKYADSKGLNLRHYLHAYKSFGHWLVLPGPIEKQSPCTYYVRAKCLICGTIYDRVCLNNLKSGKSTRCGDCNKSRNHQIQVVNAETGEVYKSIMAWSKAIDARTQYQSLRQRMLKVGEITINQQRYLLRPLG
jgi:hypothetical protein